MLTNDIKYGIILHMSDKTMSWTFSDIWNQSLLKHDERKLTKRQRIWASELGGAMIDRYLKMNAVAYTNPPNPRSLRKFDAGNLMEWIIGVVLKRAGILIEEQEWLEYDYPNLLPVTGKLDFLAGGQPSWQNAQMEIDRLEKNGFPEFLIRAARDIVNTFVTKYPFGMDTIVLEIKSCSAFMYENYERSGRGSINHVLQLFHYLKAKNLPEGHIVYVSKDDLRLLEISVFNPSPMEELYKKDIEMITQYVKDGVQPEKEKAIVFDEQFMKFSQNWRVGYSNYLTMLYGYENQKEFDDANKPVVARWNRVLGRCVDGKNMTKANEEVIVEIKASFPEFDQYVEEARVTKAEHEEIKEGGEEA